MGEVVEKGTVVLESARNRYVVVGIHAPPTG